MERSCYSIEKHRDRWSVSVGGEKVLLCDSKKIALRVVRQATDALCLDRSGSTSDAAQQREYALRNEAAPRPVTPETVANAPSLNNACGGSAKFNRSIGEVACNRSKEAAG